MSCLNVWSVELSPQGCHHPPPSPLIKDAGTCGKTATCQTMVGNDVIHDTQLAPSKACVVSSKGNAIHNVWCNIGGSSDPVVPSSPYNHPTLPKRREGEVPAPAAAATSSADRVVKFDGTQMYSTVCVVSTASNKTAETKMFIKCIVGIIALWMQLISQMM